ncbi:glycosyltransferase involved in cell wall biosynthesis [Actinoallomurus bryophytorum]|uniref:Glycosyltransferase involved in cell wall biosynthesis n=1 Tax=Actinoallomurus bryophytorum TaxID=1490222 RepID=A0A543CEG0_9ACTN|nr:glycosyltransferase family 4 protein [Actinoallomurus bryophytorum]TQL95486.1 glycosyltransferase involved in cell wall biosynthesis [Actinoallomurus bryophytorum]
MNEVDEPLRVALLSYRSKPHCGGQGVYLRHLSRELVDLGHHVDVFSGQPYPDLDRDEITLHKVPSLDLYADEDPFRTPKLKEFRDWIDVLEFAHMRTGGFPEPLTFSLRVLRELRGRRGEYDVVHDNQVLGYGNLGIPRLGLPLVTSIHHPISVDRRIEIEAAKGIKQQFGKRRWYGFVRMQARVAARVGPILTVSGSSKHDIVRDFGALPEQVHILPLGVDDDNFRPRGERVPGRIVAVASADSPLKGVATLLRAVAKLATERDVHVVVVGRPTKGGPTDKLVGELSLGDRVRFVSGISDEELGELLSSAEIAAVPSLYEGFSLPAVEHMASGTPLVASRTGALPEVVGDAAVLVEPGDVEELAAVFRRLHDSPEERERVGAAGYARVQERFTWSAVARATVGHYRDAIARRTAGAGRKEHGPADRGL